MAELLVLAETDGARILPSTLPTLAFARAYAQATGGHYDLLIVGGPEIASAAEEFLGYGAARVLVAAHPLLAHPTAVAVTAVAAPRVGAGSIAGPASTFGRDILPRIAGVLDLPMLSDVIGVTQDAGRLTFRRPMYAGNVIASVQIDGDRGVFSVRATAFGKAEPDGSRSALETLPIDPAVFPAGTTWIRLDAAEAKRPDVTAARVVVSGGRPLKDSATFERIIGGLADRLGGAAGATRAAVDSGIAPNELQVGQTGKTVAPELYIAAGVSGSVQHLAGMKESRVIVAINTDPEAPIFDVADYGLVADLYNAVPEMAAKV